MVALNPDGGIYTGDMVNTYCMTTDQIGQILAAAFLKSHEALISALMFYIAISIIIGFVLGVAFWETRARIRAREDKEDEDGGTIPISDR
jgi:hypothetical protein